jgi:thiol:disulfide interchange protein
MTEELQDNAPARRGARHTRFFLIAFAALVIVVLVQSQRDVPSAVAWGQDLSQALATANQQGKPVLINFTSAGCVYCKQMEREVIPQEEVLSEIAEFVPVKIDAWKDEATAARYGVGGLPGYVVTRPDGAPVLATSGFRPAEEFIRFLRAGRAEVARQQ